MDHWLDFAISTNSCYFWGSLFLIQMVFTYVNITLQVHTCNSSCNGIFVSRLSTPREYAFDYFFFKFNIRFIEPMTAQVPFSHLVLVHISTLTSQ